MAENGALTSYSMKSSIRSLVEASVPETRSPAPPPVIGDEESVALTVQLEGSALTPSIQHFARTTPVDWSRSARMPMIWPFAGATPRMVVRLVGLEFTTEVYAGPLRISNEPAPLPSGKFRVGEIAGRPRGPDEAARLTVDRGTGEIQLEEKHDSDIGGVATGVVVIGDIPVGRRNRERLRSEDRPGRRNGRRADGVGPVGRELADRVRLEIVIIGERHLRGPPSSVWGCGGPWVTTDGGKLGIGWRAGIARTVANPVVVGRTLGHAVLGVDRPLAKTLESGLSRERVAHHTGQHGGEPIGPLGAALAHVRPRLADEELFARQNRPGIARPGFGDRVKAGAVAEAAS